MITISLLPTLKTFGNWRSVGASGQFNGYAKVLAANLVRAGLGHAIIRLGHEANGTWYPDNVGSDPDQYSEWKQFWRQTALAMDSVAGAHFTMDWCIAIGFRAIPFASYYPGNDVVDQIGFDIYDRGSPSRSVTSGWPQLVSEPGGVKSIVAFAERHHKSLAIPEWGLDTTHGGGFGDDPEFVTGIAKTIHRFHVALQSYFFSGDSKRALVEAPRSSRVLAGIYAGGR